MSGNFSPIVWDYHFMRVVTVLVVVVLFLVSAVLLFVGRTQQKEVVAQPVSGTKGKPVLVELFTSEGCSSCPPADRVLTAIAKDRNVAGAEVIALSFHVDYWDYLGWKDKFSSAEFSKRQENYVNRFKLNSAYTPQSVVDGELQLVGSEERQLRKAIEARAAESKGDVMLQLENGTLDVRVAGLPEHSDAEVFLAVAESRLFSKIGGGENGGKMLEHTGVVRELKKLGSVGKAESSFAAKTPISISADWKAENVQLVVFVQENGNRRVLAAASIGLR
jgi:hypothetical protein